MLSVCSDIGCVAAAVLAASVRWCFCFQGSSLLSSSDCRVRSELLRAAFHCTDQRECGRCVAASNIGSLCGVRHVIATACVDEL